MNPTYLVYITSGVSTVPLGGSGAATFGNRWAALPFSAEAAGLQTRNLKITSKAKSSTGLRPSSPSITFYN